MSQCKCSSYLIKRKKSSKNTVILDVKLLHNTFERVGSYKKLVNYYHTIQNRISENSNVCSYCSGSLKFHKYMFTMCEKRVFMSWEKIFNQSCQWDFCHFDTLNWMQNDIYLEWYPIVLYEKHIQLRNAYMIIPSTLICYDENPESKICDIANIFNRGGK